MADGLPFVSVIVPVYNGQATIVQCVESLLAQDYSPDRFEIIVVDNGSKDRTIELLQPYVQSGKIKLLSETRVLNAYGARNSGAKAARGEFLAFTDADCVAKQDWLTRLLEGWRDPSIGAFIGDILAHDPKTPLERYYSDEMLSLRSKDLAGFPGMRAGNCAIRRDCFEDLGGFDAKMNSGRDSDFLARMVSETGYAFRVELDAVVFHKNFENLGSILRRGMRFGAVIDTFRNDPFRKGNFISWGANLRGIISSFVAFGARILASPLVTHGMSYRGRQVTDPALFVVEPLIRLTEMTGLLIGRTFKSQKFR